MIVVRGLGQGFPQMLLGGLDAAPSGIAMAPSAVSGRRFFFLIDREGLQVLGFEDLAAVQALDVIHAVAPPSLSRPAQALPSASFL
jgi:hypothetical protein